MSTAEETSFLCTNANTLRLEITDCHRSESAGVKCNPYPRVRAKQCKTGCGKGHRVASQSPPNAKAVLHAAKRAMRQWRAPFARRACSWWTENVNLFVRPGFSGTQERESARSVPITVGHVSTDQQTTPAWRAMPAKTFTSTSKAARPLVHPTLPRFSACSHWIEAVQGLIHCLSQFKGQLFLFASVI